jgi:predicted metal-dependent HD superfamily phosphohydrolase
MPKFIAVNYEAAEKYVLGLLKEKLSSSLLYHSLEHTLDVVEAAVRIGRSEKVSEQELVLLKTAALYHDTGFIEQYDHNEAIGCRMASETLPGFGYEKTEVAIICSIIMATDIRSTANNLLHEIIRDADLDYLGRDDFSRISNNLRKELQLHGTSYTDKEWYADQVRFLEKHYYHTLASKAERDRGKQKNLETVKKIVKLGQY